MQRTGKLFLRAVAFLARDQVFRLPHGKIAGERPEQGVARYKKRNGADPPQKQQVQPGNDGRNAEEMLIEKVHAVSSEHEHIQPCPHSPRPPFVRMFYNSIMPGRKASTSRWHILRRRAIR